MSEPATRAALLEEIRVGLSGPRKELPTKLLYDQRGSELFEEITRLPEYYLTRAEHALLREWVPEWIAELRPRSLIELGAGSAEKTRAILDAMRSAGSGGVYLPVDISADFLAETADALRSEYPGLQVIPIAADFTRAVDLPADVPRPALFTFLGSTIGNFAEDQAVDLLRRIRSAMRPEDRLLLGVDLRKDPAVLEAAYDDAQGVTAEFNLNLLRVVNRDFGADFDVGAFRHRALYDPRQHRVEMHLVADRAMTVAVPNAGAFRIAAGESIRTEISCKYDRSSLAEIFATAGLALVTWHPDAESRFALVVGEPA